MFIYKKFEVKKLVKVLNIKRLVEVYKLAKCQGFKFSLYYHMGLIEFVE